MGVPKEIRPCLVYILIIEPFRYTWECMCNMGDCEVKMCSLDFVFKVMNGSIMLCGCACGGWPSRDTMNNKMKPDVGNSKFCGALFSQVVGNIITYNICTGSDFMNNNTIMGGGVNMGNNSGD